MMKKMCSICYETKDETEFRKNKHTVNGKQYINLDSYCIDCRRLYDKERHRVQRARKADLLQKVKEKANARL